MSTDWRTDVPAPTFTTRHTALRQESKDLMALFKKVNSNINLLKSKHDAKGATRFLLITNRKKFYDAELLHDMQETGLPITIDLALKSDFLRQHIRDLKQDFPGQVQGVRLWGMTIQGFVTQKIAQFLAWRFRVGIETCNYILQKGGRGDGSV